MKRDQYKGNLYFGILVVVVLVNHSTGQLVKRKPPATTTTTPPSNDVSNIRASLSDLEEGLFQSQRVSEDEHRRLVQGIRKNTQTLTDLSAISRQRQELDARTRIPNEVIRAARLGRWDEANDALSRVHDITALDHIIDQVYNDNVRNFANTIDFCKRIKNVRQVLRAIKALQRVSERDGKVLNYQETCVDVILQRIVDSLQSAYFDSDIAMATFDADEGIAVALLARMTKDLDSARFYKTVTFWNSQMLLYFESAWKIIKRSGCRLSLLATMSTKFLWTLQTYVDFTIPADDRMIIVTKNLKMILNTYLQKPKNLEHLDICSPVFILDVRSA